MIRIPVDSPWILSAKFAHSLNIFTPARLWLFHTENMVSKYIFFIGKSNDRFVIIHIFFAILNATTQIYARSRKCCNQLSSLWPSWVYFWFFDSARSIAKQKCVFITVDSQAGKSVYRYVYMLYINWKPLLRNEQFALPMLGLFCALINVYDIKRFFIDDLE